MGYISDTARNRTHNLFRPKREPIPLGHNDGQLMIVSKLLSTFLVYSHNHYDIYVFEVKESSADISTELPCLGDLGNPGKLPVQQVLGGTDDCVL